MAAPPVVVEEVVDPQLAAQMKTQDDRFSRNLAVFRTQAEKLFREQRGKLAVVAGEELHVAETPAAAWAWARQQHPDDDGVLVHCIPREKGWRIYAGGR